MLFSGEGWPGIQKDQRWTYPQTLGGYPGDPTICAFEFAWLCGFLSYGGSVAFLASTLFVIGYTYSGQ